MKVTKNLMTACLGATACTLALTAAVDMAEPMTTLELKPSEENCRIKLVPLDWLYAAKDYAEIVK